MRSLALPFALALSALALCACHPAPGAEIPAAADTSSAPVDAGPRYLQTRESFTLYAEPSADAPSITLSPSGGAGYLLELVEDSGAWARVRTLTPTRAAQVGFESTTGLGLIELEAWLELAATPSLSRATPSASAPAAASAPTITATAHAAPRPVTAIHMVHRGAALYWPDGRVAGVVAQDHGYYGAPDRHSVADASGQALDLFCHSHRERGSDGVLEGALCVTGYELVRGGGGGVIASFDGPPSVGPAHGLLDRAEIREVVRDNIEDVRSCYNFGLAEDPNLSGRVSIQFVIISDGTVGSTTIKESDLPEASAGVAECIASVAKNWHFPRPRGDGNVIVVYPFNLSPE